MEKYFVYIYLLTISLLWNEPWHGLFQSRDVVSDLHFSFF